jgi:short-subunit dehydrogenase
MQLRDKTIVLTGATGGIGSALTVMLASAGARLILVGRDLQKLELLQASIDKGSSAHVIVLADIADAAQRNALIARCLQEEVDGLINNAGVCQFALLGDTSDSMIGSMLDLNLQVPILLTKALLPALIQRPESLVVNVGSAFGSIGHPAYSVYCGTKFGLRGFSEALRREMADTSMNVLHIEPRSTITAINSSQVVAMNKELGNTMDQPEFVAAKILRRIEKNKWGSSVIGWPEKFYAKVNACLPSVADQAIKNALSAIKRNATATSARKQ